MPTKPAVDNVTVEPCKLRHLDDKTYEQIVDLCRYSSRLTGGDIAELASTILSKLVK